MVILIPHHFSIVTEASGRLSSQASTNAHAEPGAYAFFMGSLCHAPKFPKAFLKHHCLDVGGAFLATQECGGYSVHHLHPFILRYSLSSLCPSGVTPCGRHHPGSLPRRGLAEKVISGERGRSGQSFLYSSALVFGRLSSCVSPELKIHTRKSLLIGSNSYLVLVLTFPLLALLSSLCLTIF